MDPYRFPTPQPVPARHRLRWSVALAACLLVSQGGWSADDISIMPDHTTLMHINLVVGAQSSSEFFQELGALKQLVDGQVEALIPQLLYYQVQMRLRIEERLREHGPAEYLQANADESFLIFEHLYPEMSIRPLLGNLAPYLDATDSALREHARIMLIYVRERIGYGPLVAYASEETDRRVSDPLVKTLYRSDAGEALLAFLDHYAESVVDGAAIREAEALVRSGANAYPIPDDVTSTLTEQIEHERWWVRLYAAEMLRQHPRIASGALLGDPSQETHPLVREALAAIAE